MAPGNRRGLSLLIRIQWACYLALSAALFLGAVIYENGAMPAEGTLCLEEGSSVDITVMRVFPSYLNIELAIFKSQLKPRLPAQTSDLMPYAAESGEPIALTAQVAGSETVLTFEDRYRGRRESSSGTEIFRRLHLASDAQPYDANRSGQVLLPWGRISVRVGVREVGPLLRGVTATVLLTGPINIKKGTDPAPWTMFTKFFLWPIGAIVLLIYGSGLAFATFRRRRKTLIEDKTGVQLPSVREG